MDKNKEKTKEAREYLKLNKRELIKQFASLKRYPPVENPFSIFMAGSPGAGKTEASEGLIKGGLIEKMFGFKCLGGVVRVDDDEIRYFFKDIGYDGTNTDLFRSASILGVEKVFDFSLKNGQNLILDSTFSNYEKSRENIKRSLRKRRSVGIFYLYIDPIIAWNFTLKRAKIIGRSVPRSFFIESLFHAKENVNKIKSEFGSKVELTLLERSYDRDKRVFRGKTTLNIENIDNYLKIKYTKDSLNSKLC